ncbi:MAG TPA: C25 family peptidase C-terminal domain-containing protein, partial [Candidatus Cloacimonadota bacterium]|nr:C25 family peptidase C-terminal domain-containing protein [Candidatus Cloacimonadota bacterium]
GWYSPAFTVTNANAMTNTGKYGVMVGNCCLTNAFNTGVCFGEALLRKANAGAVAYIGGTNSTYWSEDYWWGIGYKTPIQAAAHPYSATTLGAYDAMFHTHNEAFTDWATSLGEANYMGNLAVVQGASSYQNYYWEIYSIDGDPSLMTYFGVPTANNATYPSQIMIGASSITVTAQPYSRVALTQNGTIYGTAIVPSTGTLNLTITPFGTVGTAKLVITAQNKITLQQDISIIANNSAFVTVSANTYGDSNNNVAEYNETGRYSTTFYNSGTVASGAIAATLTCTTPGISITDGTESIAALAAGATSSVTNAFSFTVANNIVNQLTASFTITMVSGSNTWTYPFTQIFNAPALAFGSLTISDPAPGNANGRIDPGETVTLTIPLNNTGAAATVAGSASLTCGTTGITVNNGTASFTAISASGSANLSFSITAASSMTIGTVAALAFNATAGAYTASKTENTAVGLITETFETGNFSSYPWVMGSYPWTIDSSTYYAGAYSAKSGTITSSQSTTMELTRNVTTAGNLTFYYKVSSESGYDFMKFYIDGTIQNGSGSSGTVDWTQASYALTTGNHVLKWEYMKDSSVDSNSDCAWIDNIVFPASTNLYTYYPPQNPTANAGNSFVNLAWQAPAFGTPTGYKIFKNSTLLTTVTGLTYNDTAVTNGVTYSYYLKAVYNGGESDPTTTMTATPNAISSVIIGAGTTSNGVTIACPINLYYKSLHGQSVYLASELNMAGVTGAVSITQIGFNITGLPGQAMPNFVVRMGTTTATDATSMVSTGLTTVYSSASYLPTATGWNMLTLSTPFAWNGTSNIVIDTAFGLMSSYTQTGTTQYTTVTNGYNYLRSDTVDETTVFTGGSTSTLRPNVKFVFPAQSVGALITVNPTTLAFGDVAMGSSANMQFTIQNTGDATLSGTITTPSGYSVALAAARSTEFGSRGNKDIRNNLSFSVNAGATKTYILTFTPSLNAAYNGNVVIASNASNGASVNLAVTGNGYDPNHTPTIDLPASFSFDKNGSLTVDFSAYVSDADNDPLTISGSCGTHVCSTITGMSVTISALQNWTGTETLTFTVSDGSASAVDSVPITVNPVTTPAWTPVTYPNNSATVYGTATIDLTACALNDVVGAFVGTECRGMAEVTTNAGTAYVTLLVNLATDGETVCFKIYDYSANSVYTVLATQALSFGQVLGSPTPLAINAVTSIGPRISVTPLTLAFGAVETGLTGVQQFTISNPGDRNLLGSIVTPTGFSVALASGRNSQTLALSNSDRNSLAYTISPGASKTYNLTFAPTAVGTYGGSVYVTNNDTTSSTILIEVSGSGYIPPTISIDDNALNAELLINAEGTDSFKISNSGSQTLTYTIAESPTVAWFSALPLSGSINAGGEQRITGSFTADGLTPGTYQTQLVISSNDPDMPQMLVSVGMVVYNTAPVINLPVSYAFDMNGSLVSDFSTLVSDVDLQPL